MNERERIALLTSIFGPALGDDCAVLAPDLVWTVDACVEGTHFRREWLSWEDLGWKSFMAAASDIAAMGADPLAALSGLVLPKDVDDAALESIARGQAAAAKEIGAAVVGGNLARGTELSVTTTVLGRTDRPITRTGAKPGDLLLASGPIGHAAAGLAALQFNNMQTAHIGAWRRPRARIAEGRAMRAHATSAIDISDGLAIDAHRLAEASGVALVIEDEALATYGVAREHILGGGEDYALLATSPETIEGFIVLGRVEQGKGVRLASGEAIAAVGFDHF